MCFSKKKYEKDISLTWGQSCLQLLYKCPSVWSGGGAQGSGRGTLGKKSKQPTGGAQFVGLELYKRLKDYLKKYLVDLQEVSS